MESRVINIERAETKLLANQYAKYKFVSYFQNNGAGHYYSLEFQISPSWQSDTGSEILLTFKYEIKENQIIEEFKNGVENFAIHLFRLNKCLSNSIHIQIDTSDFRRNPKISNSYLNELCIENALSHIYLKTKLDQRTIFVKQNEQYDEIHLELNNLEGVILNNTFLKWRITMKEFIDQFGINDFDICSNVSSKHFSSSIILSYSNTISNRAFVLNVGFNSQNEFMELSCLIGYKIRIKDWNFKYCDLIKKLLEVGKEKGYLFSQNGKGDYKCEELGIIFSESFDNHTRTNNGMLEYIYFTEPQNANS